MAKETRVMITSSSLWPMCLVKGGWGFLVSELRKLGYEGIEFLFTQGFMRKHHFLLPQLEQAGLTVTGHLWWTQARSAEILRCLRIFPSLGKTPSDFTLPPIPTVVSSYQEEWLNQVTNPLYQLVSGTAPYSEQARRIREQRRRVVFDVAHALEYFFHGKTIPTDMKELFQVALQLFSDLQKFIDEIHVYGFGVEKDGAGFCNMNQTPTSSEFPILDFIAAIHRQGWKGRIVWEIDPRVAFKLFWMGELWNSLDTTSLLTQAAIKVAQ